MQQREDGMTTSLTLRRSGSAAPGLTPRGLTGRWNLDVEVDRVRPGADVAHERALVVELRREGRDAFGGQGAGRAGRVLDLPPGLAEGPQLDPVLARGHALVPRDVVLPVGDHRTGPGAVVPVDRDEVDRPLCDRLAVELYGPRHLRPVVPGAAEGTGTRHGQ